MIEEIFEEFKKTLGEDRPFGLRGAFSPLMIFCAWTRPDDANALTGICAFNGRDNYTIFSDDHYRGLAEAKFREFMRDEVMMTDLIQMHEDLYRDAWRLYSRYSVQGNFEELTTSELQQKLKDAQTQLSVLISKSIYIEIFDKDIIFDVIDAQAGERTLAHWEAITHPTTLSFENRRNQYILEIAKDKDIEEIVRLARYVYTDYSTVHAESYVREHIQSVLVNRKEIEVEISERLSAIEDNKRSLDIELAKESTEIKKVAAYTQFVINQRDLRKDPIAQIGVVMADLAQEIFRRLNLPEDKVYSFLGYEIAAMDTEHPEQIREQIRSREKGALWLIRPDGNYRSCPIDYSLAVNRFEDMVHGKTVAKITELKGSTASKGLVRGRVRVVLDALHAHFEDGEILVTSMTRPEFVPIMKRSGAIVTDEGGLLSHAAIMSREFNKPCVIATKIATRVLHDGDMVEVDADKGVVRKL